MDKDTNHMLPTSTYNICKYDQSNTKAPIQNQLRFQVQTRIREIQKDYEKQVSHKENQKLQIKHDLLNALIAQEHRADQESEQNTDLQETLSNIYSLTLEEFTQENIKTAHQSQLDSDFIQEDIDTLHSLVDITEVNGNTLLESSREVQMIHDEILVNQTREKEAELEYIIQSKEKSYQEYYSKPNTDQNTDWGNKTELQEELEKDDQELEEQEFELEQEEESEDEEEKEEPITETVLVCQESRKSEPIQNSAKDYIAETEECSLISSTQLDTLSQNFPPTIFYLKRSSNYDTLISTGCLKLSSPSSNTQEILLQPNYHAHKIQSPDNFLTFCENSLKDNFFTFGENSLKDNFYPSSLSTRPVSHGTLETTFTTEETLEEEKSPQLLIIEYDTDQVKHKKLLAQQEIIHKRDEELVKRHHDLQAIRDSPSINPPKKRESPMIPRVKDAKKQQTNKNLTKEPSKYVERSPFLQPEIQESPKEEVKAHLDQKYRRHKNLPNLVYHKQSNKNLIKNAICQVCLAGEPNKKQREDLIEVILNNPEVSNFVILFKGELTRWDLNGLYEHDVANQILKKVHGKSNAPEVINPAMVQTYFRYDSGTKEFKTLGCKTITTTVDAVSLKTLHKH